MRTRWTLGACLSIAMLCGASCSGGGTDEGGMSGGSGDGQAGAGSGGEDTDGGSGGAGTDAGGSDLGGAPSGGSGGTGTGGSGGSGGAGGAGNGTGGLGGGSNGACGWTFTAGGTLEDQAHAVVALSDGSVVVVGITGSTNSPFGDGSGAFAVRLSESGEVLWSAVYPGLGGTMYAAPGHDGKLVVSGTALSADACAEHHGAEDVWVAEISPDDGSIVGSACIGGDDDDSAGGVIARGAGASAHYLVTGAVDSHESGNIGTNHNGGGFDATDVLLGYWTPSTDVASGECFGSDGPDVGTGFLGVDRILSGTSGDGSGDFLGQDSFGYGDLAVVSLSSSDVCTDLPCATGVRLGGSQNDAALDGDGNVMVGTTASTDGPVGCPGAAQVTPSFWIGTYEGGDVPEHSCLWSGGIVGVSDLGRGEGAVAVVGLVYSPTSGDFSTATVDGAVTTKGAYIAVYDEQDLSEPEELVVVGDNTTLYGVAVRGDGCVVAVGTRAPSTFGEAFVYTTPLP